jgi:hypothetical protein
LSVKRKQAAFAMTDAHYKHIQKLIRRELGGRFESSIWFALMLAALGVAATIAITVLATEINNAARRGELEATAWGFLAIALLCFSMHFFGSRKTGKQRANDLIEMMDTYNMEIEQHSQSPMRPVVPAASPLVL